MIGIPLTIEGNGATIARSTSSGTPSFRLVAVAGPGNLALDDLTLSNGLSVTYNVNEGGGILNHGTLDLTDCRLSGNTSPVDPGGGISNDGTAIVTDSTISNNNSGDGGGGIANGTHGTLTVTNSTLAANHGVTGGGAIENAGNAFVTNSTLTGNQATSYVAAGAINNTGTLTLTNSTVADNSAPAGEGGAIQSFGTTTVANSIVADNSGGNCTQTITDAGYNLENGTSCNFSNDAVDAEPGLGSLADNGGPTETMAVTAASPAYQHANPTVCDAPEPGGAGGVDQRGVSRVNESPRDTGCDIGAFETGSLAPSVSGIDPNNGTFLGGTEVIISGTNLSATPVTVDFGTGQPATRVQMGANGTLVATAPANYPGTTVDVTVTTPAGTSAMSPADRVLLRPPGGRDDVPIGWRHGAGPGRSGDGDIDGGPRIVGRCRGPPASRCSHLGQRVAGWPVPKSTVTVAERLGCQKCTPRSFPRKVHLAGSIPDTLGAEEPVSKAPMSQPVSLGDS